MTRTTDTFQLPKLKPLTCPRCAASIDVRISQVSPSIVCGRCLHTFKQRDLTQSDQQIFKPLSSKDKSALTSRKSRHKKKRQLKLGMHGTLKGIDYEIVGLICRSSTDGENESWDEYLLYNPHRGFAWLTDHNKHWNYAHILKDIPKCNKLGDRLKYLGQTYTHYTTYKVRNHYISGEFYFKPDIDTKHDVKEYVYDDQIIVHESNANESVWSVSEYIFPELVEKAFSVNLASSQGVAVNQVLRGKRYIKPLLSMYAIFLFFIWALMTIQSTQHPLEKYIYDIISISPEKTAIYNPYVKDSFKQTPSNIKTLDISPQQRYAEHTTASVDGMTITYELTCPKDGVSSAQLDLILPSLQNDWVQTDIELINHQNGARITRTTGLEDITDHDDEYYVHERLRSITFPHLSKGTYTLKIAFKTSADRVSGLHLIFKNNVVQSENIWFLGLFAGILPFSFLARLLALNARRREERTYNKNTIPMGVIIGFFGTICIISAMVCAGEAKRFFFAIIGVLSFCFLTYFDGEKDD